MTTSLPRRFYKETGVIEDSAGFGVSLDARRLKTPGAKAFRVPTRALAEACAAEWAAQGEHIVPASTPLTQFAFAAIDHTPGRRDDLVVHVAKYGETDLCCHRAGQPAGLAARQSTAWDPLLDWARTELKLDLPVVIGVMAALIEPATLEVLRHVTRTQDDFRLTILGRATGLAGSALVGLAMTYAVLDGQGAYSAATVDEHWSIEHWGEDGEARARLDGMRAEFETLGRFIAALA